MNHLAGAYTGIAIGGVDCGKSFMAMDEMLEQLLLNPQGRGETGLVVAYRHPRQSAAPDPQEALEPRPCEESPARIEDAVLVDGSGRIRKRSQRDSAYVDELTDLDEQSYNDVFDRTGREGVPGRIWATGNPQHKGQWVYKRFLEE